MEYTSNDKNYASSGVGTAGLTLGAIATGLIVANGGLGGIGGILGGNSAATSQAQRNQELAMQVAILQSEKESSKVINDGLVAVYSELRKQDKLQDEKVASLSSRVLALETAGPLKEQIFDGKIAQVYDKITCCCNSANAAIQSSNAAIASLQNTIGNLTKTIIPIGNVCPQPMPLYNSWTQPSSTTPATTATANA